MARKIIKPPQPDLFKSRKKTAAVLQLSPSGRGHQYTYGLDSVCREMNANVTRIVGPSEIQDCRDDVLLCGMTSPMDVYPLVKNI